MSGDGNSGTGHGTIEPQSEPGSHLRRRLQQAECRAICHAASVPRMGRQWQFPGKRVRSRTSARGVAPPMASDRVKIFVTAFAKATEPFRPWSELELTRGQSRRQKHRFWTFLTSARVFGCARSPEVTFCGVDQHVRKTCSVPPGPCSA